MAVTTRINGVRYSAHCRVCNSLTYGYPSSIHARNALKHRASCHVVDERCYLVFAHNASSYSVMCKECGRTAAGLGLIAAMSEVCHRRVCPLFVSVTHGGIKPHDNRRRVRYTASAGSRYL